MSDSLPPVWGSAPWDGRGPGPLLPDEALTEEMLLAGPAFDDEVGGAGEDVPDEARRADEAVLSGLTGASGGFPGPPRPAGAVVTALLAAPGPGELDGEAAALATFRLLRLPGARPPAALSGPLPVRPADGGSRRPPGSHRRPSRAPWHGRRRMTAALAGAVTAAAGVITVTGLLTGSGSGSGSGARPAEAGPTAPAARSAAAPSTSPAVKQQAVEGHGAPSEVPTPTTSPAPSAAQLTTWCHEYVDPWSSSRHDWKAAVKQLSPVAGGKRKIDGYCWDMLGGAAGWPGSGSQQPYQPGAANGHGGFGNGPGGPGNGPYDGPGRGG